MRIKILTMGSLGDIRPYAALALGLQAKGHQVCIATDPKDEQFCRNLNLEFYPLAGDLTNIPILRETLENELSNKKCSLNKISFIQHLMHAINGLLEQQFQDVIEIAKDADTLIYHPIVFAAPHIGEALKKRSIRMQLQPDIRTKEHPSSLVQSKPSLGKMGNYLSHLISEQAFWQPIRKRINRWRVDTLKLEKHHYLSVLAV